MKPCTVFMLFLDSTECCATHFCPFKMQRAVVGVRKNNGKYALPKFSDCLLDYFVRDQDYVTVNFSLEDGVLFLNENSEGYELRHSPECPIKLAKDDLVNVRNDLKSHIEVAASVVIESSDAHVLLTRRSSHLRSSPNVWVVPGGHLEYGETVFEGGFRELKEETGLDLAHKKASVLGLWENVYPLLLGLGTPKSHVLVVYLHTCLGKTFKELMEDIKPSPDEVDSFCWLNSSTLSKLFSNVGDSKLEGKQYKFEDGEIVEKHLNYNSIFNNWLRTQPNPYSGVNFALRKWMEKCHLNTLPCKI